MQNSYEWLSLLSAGLCAACLAGCASAEQPMTPAQISHQPFGKTKDGTPVDIEAVVRVPFRVSRNSF